MKRPSITIPAVIHLFAAAHVAVAVLSRIFNYVDDVPLTVLTLSMILIISVRRGLRVELVATLALICIFVAYLFGIYGARFFEQLLGCGIAAPAITTAIVTELIGWLTYAFARSRNPQTSRRMQWSPSTRQIVVSVAAILLFRIFYTSLFSSPYFEQQGIYPEFYRLLGNTLALMTMFCGNIIFVNQRARLFRRRGLRLAASALFTLGFVLLLTAAVYFGLPQGNGAALSARHFFRLYTVVLLVDIVVYAARNAARNTARCSTTTGSNSRSTPTSCSIRSTSSITSFRNTRPSGPARSSANSPRHTATCSKKPTNSWYPWRRNSNSPANISTSCKNGSPRDSRSRSTFPGPCFGAMSYPAACNCSSKTLSNTTS